MSRPNFITFTGIDERTNIEELSMIHRKYYGRVEFAVLVSDKQHAFGNSRYPCPSYRRHLTSQGFPVAGHICGDRARQANRGEIWFRVLSEYQDFCRVQVNVGDPAADSLRVISNALFNKPVIAQCRTDFPANEDVSWLFDQSGGSGRAPDYWPKSHTSRLVGYAGGLGPDNVMDAIKNIGASNYWLDMESGVRTDNWFDTVKCIAVLRAVYG